MLSAAQMLDELMGRDRNLAPTEKRREIHWEDADVCKYFLCGFCPHELFVNTRADLGQCEKFHDEKLKASYEKSSRYECMGYEEEFLRFLQTLLADVERRIRKGQARLTLNNSQGGVSNMASGPQVAREEKISMLTEKINSLVQQAEELGCEGKVEDAQGMMKLCEQLTEERTQLENMQTVVRSRDLEHSKDMQVCEICGALLVVGDAQQRVDEHLLGKQHMGYAQIRSYVETRKENSRKKLRDEGAEREAKRAKEREERDKEREARDKEREEYRKKREQEDKERAEKRRHRSRSKSRSKRRSRSRSPGGRRHRRSRSRDRRRRTRSRDREGRSTRSRDRRHSRHASRDRKSREKSSRHRDRSRERSSRRSRAKDEDMDVKEKMKTDGSGDQKLAEDSESATNMDTNDSASLPASSTKDHDGQEN